MITTSSLLSCLLNAVLCNYPHFVLANSARLARVGDVADAKTLVLGRLDRGTAMLRFPGFYGIMADANWVPDEGHASILKMTLQYMLLYSDSKTGKIFLFGAWPEGWDVDGLLHAEGGTTVDVACEGGKLTKLIVSPPERRKDVVFVQPYCRQ